MNDHASASIDPTDRHALYYPYIHIRDENWLKGTILAFQQVRRIVPNRFTVKDQPITKAYAELEGPAGALLEPVIVAAPEIEASQIWLRSRINERLDKIVEMYSRDKVPPTLQSGPESFQMHVGKILDENLLELLKSRDLAWHSREPMEPDSINWITMHPKLGSAMMSVLALAVARIKGLSVVTPSESTHHQLLANREEQVFEKLLDVPVVPGALASPGVSVEELSQVIITVGFDLTRLTPAQICELLKEGKDLRAFRRTVSNFARQIPAGLDREEREKQLRKQAVAVLDEWNSYSGSLPAFAKKALVDAALDKVPEKAIEVAIAGMAGLATGATVIGALPGILVTVGVVAGVNMYRNLNAPLRFLSRVDKVVNRSIGSIYVPQWSALASQSV